MQKSPDAFRTISEVADLLETPAHVLRFWESRFPQIRPVKRAGGRRYYRPADIALLAGIRHLLHDQGMTIRGVQKLLREQGVRHVGALGGSATGLAFDGQVLTDGADAAGNGAQQDQPLAGPEPSDPAPAASEAPFAENDDAPSGHVIPWPGMALPMAASAPAADGRVEPAAEMAPVDATEGTLAPVPEDAATALAVSAETPAAPIPVHRTVQGDLFGDLPLFRQGDPSVDAAPVPAAALHAGAEPAAPTEPGAPEQALSQPGTALSAADIRSLVVRIRRLPPGALAQAGLGLAVARLSTLRDRMKAPLSGHAS